MVSVGSNGIKLHACREDGTLESQVVELQWDCIRQWEADDEGLAFCLRYNRPDKTPRWLKIFTPYVSIFYSSYSILGMFDLFIKIDFLERSRSECKD